MSVIRRILEAKKPILITTPLSKALAKASQPQPSEPERIVRLLIFHGFTRHKGGGELYVNTHKRLVVQLYDDPRWRIGKYRKNPVNNRVLFSGTGHDELQNRLQSREIKFDHDKL
jgi:hypothetical protein